MVGLETVLVFLLEDQAGIFLVQGTDCLDALRALTALITLALITLILLIVLEMVLANGFFVSN